METDFYELLGVARTATDDELKKAYRKLARELHPDANPNDPEAEERFKQVTLAYEVLRDPERRHRYDQFGIDGIRGAGATGAGGDPFGFGGMNLGDLFDAFFGGGSPFGGGTRNTSGPPAGSDMQASVLIDFEAAVFGGDTEVKLRLPVTCDVCDGSGAEPGTEVTVCPECRGQGEIRRVRQSILGQVVTAAACPRCGGTGRDVTSLCKACHGDGRRTEERQYTVQIPAGIDSGQTLRLTGKGAAGSRGGPPGDLYIRVDVKPHRRFERHGLDLVHQLHIAMTQAVLGVQMDFETLDGSELLVIAPGTETGRVLRLRGKGVPNVSGRGRGDILIQVIVDIPSKLSKSEEQLMRDLADMRNESVADHDPGLFEKFKDAFR